MSGSTYRGRQAALTTPLQKSGKALHLMAMSSEGSHTISTAFEASDSWLQQLRAAMSENSSRVVDVLHDIDHDGSVRESHHPCSNRTTP